MACIAEPLSCDTVGQAAGEPEPRQQVEDVESDPTSTEIGSDDSDADSDASEDSWPELFAAEDTLLIFDWDDTILPSTWLSEQGLRVDDGVELSAIQRNMLKSLADRANETLSAAKRHGKVVLVTNAEQGWVELSCQKYMPDLMETLQDIRVLSARSTYEWQGVASPFQWKHLAFEREILSFLRESCSDNKKQIISVGDSPHERQALIRVTELVHGCAVKSLKLAERPTLANMTMEHELVSSCLYDIVNYDGSLDICLSG